MKNFIPIKKLFFVLLVFTSILNAQTSTINGPTGSEKFGEEIKVLLNGNFVIVDSYYDDGAIANVGAVYLYNGATKQLIPFMHINQSNLNKKIAKSCKIFYKLWMY